MTVPTILTPLITSDTFAGGARAGINGWSPSSNGVDNWNVIINTPTIAVVSSEGTLTSTTGGAFLLLGTETGGNVEAVVRVANQQNSDEIRVLIRSNAACTQAYYARLKGQNIGLFRLNSGSTQLANVSAGVITAGSFYWIRFRGSGSSLMARVWLDGNAEPGTWTVTATDSFFTGVGRCGLSVLLNLATNTVKFDNVNFSQAPTGGISAAAFRRDGRRVR